MMHYYPIDQATDRLIRAALVERVRERSRANFEWIPANMPGLKEKTGRERLGAYRQADLTWWTTLFATYPQLGKAAVLDYSHLVQKYGSVGEPVI